MRTEISKTVPRVLLSLVILLGAIVSMTGCNRTAPVYNVDDTPIPHATQQKYSAPEIGHIIAKTALNNGWTVDEPEPGVLHVTLKWNSHTPEADINTAMSCLDGCTPETITSAANITYSEESYNIQVDPTHNVNQSDTVAYRRYNQSVKKLRDAIDKSLSRAAFN